MLDKVEKALTLFNHTLNWNINSINVIYFPINFLLNIELEANFSVVQQTSRTSRESLKPGSAQTYHVICSCWHPACLSCCVKIIIILTGRLLEGAFHSAGTLQDAERHKHSERHGSRSGWVSYPSAEGKLASHELACWWEVASMRSQKHMSRWSMLSNRVWEYASQ